MLSFEKPEEYSLPEGVEDGEDFKEIATFKVSEDGKITLLEIDGNALESEDDKKKKKPKGMIEKSKEDFDPAAQAGT